MVAKIISDDEKIKYTRVLEILVKQHFKEFLDKDGITDICYNGDDLIFYMDHSGKWKKEFTSLRYDDAYALAVTAATARQKTISPSSPILSADLPDGERIQFNIPPSVDRGKCIISIRIPSKKEFTIEDYKAQGMFEFIEKEKDLTSATDKELIELYKNKKYDIFLKKAVEYKKNIIFSGDTGTGKTTFAKTFINYIPSYERLISIEDTKEIVFTKHDNAVNLYYPDTASSSDALNAAKLLNSCLRLNPDRILMTEIRDEAGYHFLNSLKSGHSGSITSMHAENVKMAFSRLINMYQTNPAVANSPYEVARDDVKGLVDIIICLHKEVNSNKRYISDIYFKEVDYAQ